MIKSSSRWRAAYCSGFGPLRAIGWVPDISRLGTPQATVGLHPLWPDRWMVLAGRGEKGKCRFADVLCLAQ